MIKAASAYLLDLLPRTRLFNFIHSLVYFVYAQGRFPRRNSGLINDYMFFLKIGRDLADPLRQITSDKVYAKYFINGIVGRKVTPETFAVFSSVDDIRRSELPDRCVLKPAHGSGTIVFLEDASQELGESDREKLRNALAFDLYRQSREINYKYLRKRIICEQLLQSADEAKDYKLFCYRGALKFVQVDWDRHGLHKQNFYDSQWNRIDVSYNNNPAGEWEPVPGVFAKMREVAEKLAQHFEAVRVDLYLIGDAVHVGELTHCHNRANGAFGSLEEERTISRMLFG